MHNNAGFVQTLTYPIHRAVEEQIYMASRLVMSLKRTSEHLFQLVYFPSPQTWLLNSINILHIDLEPHGRTWSCRNHTQQDLLQLYMPSINKEARLHQRVHALTRTNTHPRTHLEKAKFKYPNDFSSMCPTHMHNPSIFSLTLICLCINIRGLLRLVGRGLAPRLSSYSPQVWTSANCLLRWQWTYPHAATLPSSSANRVCRSPQATWDIFRDDGRLWNKRGASWKKHKVPSEVKKLAVSLRHSVVKLVYSISLANIPKTGTAPVDPLGAHEDRTTWTTEGTRKKRHTPLWRWAV